MLDGMTLEHTVIGIHDIFAMGAYMNVPRVAFGRDVFQRFFRTVTYGAFWEALQI
jgi:hypothetical protein